MVPVIGFDRRFSCIRLVAFPSDAGIVPSSELNLICKFVKCRKEPIDAGTLPVNEQLSSARYVRFSIAETDVGIKPDRELLLSDNTRNVDTALKNDSPGKGPLSR